MTSIRLRRRPLARMLVPTSALALFSAVTLAVLSLRAPAAAAGPGAFSLKTNEATERNGECHIKVRIDLPRPPPMMHTPMRFTFSKEVVDERAIMSKGAEPVHHRVVLDTPTKQIVGLDVDFADASGKVFKSTYFEFDLKRSDGYFEAGEYVVGLSGPDGEVGNNQKLTLKGDNPPVYRGAMDFAEEKKNTKKGVKLQAVSSGVDGGAEVAQNDSPAAAAGAQNGDIAAEGTAPDMVPKSAFNKTAEEESVQDHPKGCGCVAAGLEDGASAGALTALGFALSAGIARRRRGGDRRRP
ncbi:MAG: hypothetical protein JOZ69_03650 [Myxococcales bacterium]|nr:hypothetical protein [Myxococcales bacterium]